MPSVERTVTTTTPLTRVWEYLHDFSNATEWGPPTKTCERIGGDGGLGTTYRNVSEILGQEQEVMFEVVGFVEYQRLQLAGDAGDALKLLDTITFAETDEGTAVTYHAEFMPQGAAKVAGPLAKPALELLGTRVADSLEKALEDL